MDKKTFERMTVMAKSFAKVQQHIKSEEAAAKELQAVRRRVSNITHTFAAELEDLAKELTDFAYDLEDKAENN